MELDPNRVIARMGKCFTPECEEDPVWFAYSWWRYCAEHVPERKQNPKRGYVYIWHTFDTIAP
jgi:hypothetical protein